MKKHDKQTALALGTFVKLLRASDSIATEVHKKLGSDLTVSQFGVLEALYHLGSMSQKELGEKILKSAGNITMVIDNLEKRALVERMRSEKDRRRYLISLTKIGAVLIEKIFPAHAENIRHRMSALSDGELVSLSNLLRKLKKSE